MQCNSIVKVDLLINDEETLIVWGRIQRPALGNEIQHTELLPKLWCYEQVAHAGHGTTIKQVFQNRKTFQNSFSTEHPQCCFSHFEYLSSKRFF